jgi:hypothetical protein
VVVLWALATPTIGLPKSSPPKPTARSVARLGARSYPSVIRLLQSFSGMGVGSVTMVNRRWR